MKNLKNFPTQEAFSQLKASVHFNFNYSPSFASDGEIKI